MTYRDHLRLLVLTGCAALVAVSCAHEVEQQTLKSSAAQRDADSRGREHEGPGEGEGERKKKWSGISYAAQTYVQLTPSASLATSGFDSERVWGGTDGTRLVDGSTADDRPEHADLVDRRRVVERRAR